MPGITRDAGADVAGGAIIQGSGNVFANNKPVVRKGDAVGSGFRKCFYKQYCYVPCG